MAYDAGNGQERLHPFQGEVAHWHIDGRHIFVQFNETITEDERKFDVGWFDAAKKPELKRRHYEAGARVKGEAKINDTNLAVIQTLEKIPRPKLTELVARLFTRRTAQEE